MRQYFTLAGILLLSLLISCAPKEIPAFQEVRFSAGPCYGTCPIFDLMIKDNGDATYSAHRYNSREGEFHVQLNQTTMDTLRKLLREADILSLDSNYTVNKSDQSTYSLSVSMKNGSVKSIKDYGGSGPESLQRIYDFLFALKESQPWH